MRDFREEDKEKVFKQLHSAKTGFELIRQYMKEQGIYGKYYDFGEQIMKAMINTENAIKLFKGEKLEQPRKIPMGTGCCRF